MLMTNGKWLGLVKESNSKQLLVVTRQDKQSLSYIVHIVGVDLRDDTKQYSISLVCSRIEVNRWVLTENVYNICGDGRKDTRNKKLLTRFTLV